MAGGPRIEPFWRFDLDPDYDHLLYRAKCCVNYREWWPAHSRVEKAQEALSIHLRQEHGMMIKPHLLEIGEVPEREE